MLCRFPEASPWHSSRCYRSLHSTGFVVKGKRNKTLLCCNFRYGDGYVLLGCDSTVLLGEERRTKWFVGFCRNYDLSSYSWLTGSYKGISNHDKTKQQQQQKTLRFPHLCHKQTEIYTEFYLLYL